MAAPGIGGNLMATDPTTPRSRRAILAAAAGSAAAAAATAILPSSVAAVSIPMVTEAPNNTTAETSVVDTGDRTTAWKVTNVGVAPALVAFNAVGVATTPAQTDPTDPGGVTSAAAVYAYSVDNTTAAPAWQTTFTGVYGNAPAGDLTNTFGVGVWGDSGWTGVYGTGTYGVVGFGAVGVEGDANSQPNSVGVWAFAPSTSQFALKVTGKVSFSRSGRRAVAAGKSYLLVTMVGVSATSKVFAVLATSESGRWVRAVVPAAGKFYVYFNLALASSAVVSYFVLD